MDWAGIITAVGALIGALGGVYAIWTKYNQDTKNKRTDYELEKLRNEDMARNKRRSDNAMLVYYSLWELLYAIKADRVYVVQPHPLGNEEMLTIHFEVKRKWAEPMKPHIQNMKISEVARFSGELVKNVFMYISDIDTQVEDRYAQSIFSLCGTNAAVVNRLSDNKHDWVGSIICEFTDSIEVSEDEARELMHKTATDIQYILPEIRD